MNLKEVYFKANTEDEARVIVKLLQITVDDSLVLIYYPKAIWADKNGINGCRLSDVGTTPYTKDRTEASIEDLFHFALRGFKEPWEVPPKGYRLVTEEEMNNNRFPGAGIVKYSMKSWYSMVDRFNDNDGILWRNNDYVAFVPKDYQFKPPALEIPAEEAMRLLAEIKEAARSLAEKCEVKIVK